MTAPGWLVSFEGGEGAGKSTVLQAVGDLLQRLQVPHRVTREPGGTALGEALRALVLDPAHAKLCAEAELLIMFAARAQLLREVIQPTLQQGAWVVSDRFTDASYAYQGGGRGIPEQRIAELEHWAALDTQPRHTFLLDLPVTEGLRRAQARGQGADRIESQTEAFFERVRAAYRARAAAHPHRFSVVDASQPLTQVVAQVLVGMERLVAEWKRPA